MTIRKVKTESELRTYLSKPYWDCILIEGGISVEQPIYVDRNVTIMGGQVFYEGGDSDMFKSAAFIVRSANAVKFYEVTIFGSFLQPLQSGILINNPAATVTIDQCCILWFNYAGIWQFASSKVIVSNTLITGTDDATKGYNYGIWQGGKSDIPEQRLYVTASKFYGSRHAIGASYHPNSYYVTGCNVSSLKHSFDRHNWNAGGRKGGLHTVISGNTFTDPDRLAFSIEPPYEGGHFSFTGNKLNHAASRHVGEISDVRVYEGSEGIRVNIFTNQIKTRQMKEGKINWTYFFGGSGGKTFYRYYKAEINGKRVEKHASNRGVKYSIGNIDEAKKKYKTEKELLEACEGK